MSEAPEVWNGKEHRTDRKLTLRAETGIAAVAPQLAELMRAFAQEHSFAIDAITCTVELTGDRRMSETEKHQVLLAVDGALWGMDASLSETKSRA